MIIPPYETCPFCGAKTCKETFLKSKGWVCKNCNLGFYQRFRLLVDNNKISEYALTFEINNKYYDYYYVSKEDYCATIIGEVYKDPDNDYSYIEIIDFDNIDICINLENAKSIVERAIKLKVFL